MLQTFKIVKPLALAVVAAGSLLTATFAVPAPARAADEPFYVAELAGTTAKDRVISDGTAWVCGPTKCIAAKTRARPLRVCRGLHGNVGTISSFIVDGEAMSAEQLAKCNA